MDEPQSWAAGFARELVAVDLLGAQAPATLRQARRLARQVDRNPVISPALVEALVLRIDALTMSEIAKLESWADCATMRRLRTRAAGLQAPLASRARARG